MSSAKHFVSSNNVPEFIKQDHELFDTFVKAYYEWLSLRNDSDSVGYSDAYKSVGNPGYIIDHHEIITDLDETIDEFIDYFAQEVVPISLEGIQTDPRFFLKKIRDLYLAKGTVQSFVLFFKLYWNDNIDVFETRDAVLRASDGKYFSFPTAHFQVIEYQDQFSNMEFTLSELLDSEDVLISVVLDATVIGETNAGNMILRVKFASDIQLDSTKTYVIKSANNNTRIGLSPFVSVSNVQIADSAPLYESKDPFFLQSKELGKEFTGSLNAPTKGKVIGIKVRDQGFYYTVGDIFRFTDGVQTLGSFEVTEVDNNGSIQSINNIKLRTGSTNNGYSSSAIEDAYISITEGGSGWKTLPNIIYSSESNYQSDIGKPYIYSQNTGFGLQAIPVSNSIGIPRSVSFTQDAYFLNDSDVKVVVPANIVIENNNLQNGDIVAFQYFSKLANFGPFLSDSESITLKFRQRRLFETHIETDYIYKESEIRTQYGITIPYAFDSDIFDWKYKNVRVDSNFTDFWQEVEKLLESESNLSYKLTKRSYDPDTADGGGFSDNTSDSEISAAQSFGIDSETIILDGGDWFGFAGSSVEELVIEYEGQFLSALERYHFNQLDNAVGMDSDYLDFSYEVTDGVVRLLESYEDSDMGKWTDTGRYGKVVGIGHNNQVVKVIDALGSDLPTQKEIDLWSREYKRVVRLSKVLDGVSNKEGSLPLNNIIHEIKRASVSYDVGVVSTVGSKFYTSDGFISSDYGGTIIDDYYYSDWSYRIRSKLPLEAWKYKFKTMLHPAGMVMTAEYVDDFETPPIDKKIGLKISGTTTTRMTFDQQNEFVGYDNPKNITADNMRYRSNAFEAMNDKLGYSYQLEASNIATIRDINTKTQSGNGWWDYEPIGWVNILSTQDSDQDGNVANKYRYYNFYLPEINDFYKNNSRVDKNYRNIMVSKVQFDDLNLDVFTAYDSDLPDGFFANFNDSDTPFRAINYDRLKNDSDNRLFYYSKINRLAEIDKLKNKDLELAMREDGSLIWDDSDKIYTNYEAYERKWNQINNRRTINLGYTQFGAVEYNSYIYKRQNEEYRRNTVADIPTASYNIIKPYNNDTWEHPSLNWRSEYYGINKIIGSVDPVEPQAYRDPKAIMRGRRGS